MRLSQVSRLSPVEPCIGHMISCPIPSFCIRTSMHRTLPCSPYRKGYCGCSRSSKPLLSLRQGLHSKAIMERYYILFPPKTLRNCPRRQMIYRGLGQLALSCDTSLWHRSTVRLSAHVDDESGFFFVGNTSTKPQDIGALRAKP
jgi:hypothetical protein